MAFLKGIELQGFKSFAGKTVMSFPARVVSIVGPNGSGKSNIIDAFRWVLGEREAKQLRGGTLENLIFAGTPKRAAVGLAKVGLLFDNADRAFPVDSNEVFLERRIDRAGTSQFSINGDDILMRDLVPMLARAKLGARGLTMIRQGESDVFVASSAEARRLMIEEVLGLKEYRIKKTQAERRLESSKINMDKVRAMAEELLPHLRLLRRQKQRWARRSEIESELRTLENSFYTTQYGKLAKELSSAERPPESIMKKRGALEDEIKKLDETARQIDKPSVEANRSRAVRDEVGELFRRRGALAAESAKIEAKMEMLQNRPTGSAFDHDKFFETAKGLVSEMEEAAGWADVERIKTALRLWAAKLSKFFSQAPAENDGALAALIKNKEAEVRKIDARIKELREEEEKLARESENANKKFRELIGLIEEKKNEVRKIDVDVREYSFAVERVVLRMEEIEREWEGIGRAKNELKNMVSQGSMNTLVNGANTSEAERRMFRLRGELSAMGDVDEALVREADESETRYEFLSRELTDLDRAIGDLKKLITDLDTRIDGDFKEAFKKINDEFNNHFRLMFGGGKARLKLERKKTAEAPEANSEGEFVATAESRHAPENENAIEGVEIEINLPKKKISDLSMLSGGEKSLVSIAALFALIAVTPPPFLVLDEVDAPLDELNARRFAELVKEFSSKTQFIIVTHNRATMEVADALYGVTMADDGVSKLLSMKFEEAK